MYHRAYLLLRIKFHSLILRDTNHSYDADKEQAANYLDEE